VGILRMGARNAQRVFGSGPTTRRSRLGRTPELPAVPRRCLRGSTTHLEVLPPVDILFVMPVGLEGCVSPDGSESGLFYRTQASTNFKACQ